MREQLLLDSAYLETPMQSTAVYVRTHMRKSIIHHIIRPIETSLFKRLTNFLVSKVNTFFYSQMCMQYLRYAGPTNAFNSLYLAIGHMRILQFQFAHSINFSKLKIS